METAVGSLNSHCTIGCGSLGSASAGWFAPPPGIEVVVSLLPDTKKPAIVETVGNR